MGADLQIPRWQPNGINGVGTIQWWELPVPIIIPLKLSGKRLKLIRWSNYSRSQQPSPQRPPIGRWAVSCVKFQWQAIIMINYFRQAIIPFKSDFDWTPRYVKNVVSSCEEKIERCIELFNSLFSVPKFDNVPISFPSFLNGWHSTSGISSVLGLWHGRECYFFLCSSIILPWSIAAVREKISPLYRVNYCICFVARYLKRLLNLALTPLRWLPDSIGGKLLKKAWNVWEILLFKFYYIIN